MAMKIDFDNTVQDKKVVKELKKLTVLQEDDPNTIYNMIFTEKSEKNEGQKT